MKKDVEDIIIKKKNICKKNSKGEFGLGEVVFLLVLTCVTSLILGYSVNRKTVSLKNVGDDNLQEFIDNYNYIVDNYYDDIDKKNLVNSAINGMLSSLDDPYSMYMDEDASDNFNITLEGEYKGIGVQITTDKDGNIVVYSVFEDSPASVAGLQPNDIILSLNGERLQGKSADYFSNIVKNGKETEFKLEIKRDKEQKELVIKRSNVSIKSVTTKYFEENNHKTGYIFVSIFAGNTYEQFKKALQELENKNIDSLIIDLRSNTGGHLSVAKNIISLFLDSSHVIYQTKDKKETIKHYSTGTMDKSYKIAILTNQNSASASEIVTAALKEELKAISIGKKTYGKGTVQNLIDLSDGTQYKFTTQKWLTPNGVWVNGNGVEVDYDVELDEKYYKEPSDENDTQLKKALEVLQK